MRRKDREITERSELIEIMQRCDVVRLWLSFPLCIKRIKAVHKKWQGVKITLCLLLYFQNGFLIVGTI